MEQERKEKIERAIRNANASLAMEGLIPDPYVEELGRQMLEGKITAEEAIARIKKLHGIE